MALVRWQPVRESSSLQNDMNRLFNHLLATPTAGNGAVRRSIPAMDVVETDDHFVLKADLPGLTEEDVNIDVDDNVLTVSGERKAQHEDEREGYVRVERSYGSFRRSLTLPEALLDADAVTASFARGVLEISIPKPEQRKPRRVAIQVGSDSAPVEGTEAACPPEATDRRTCRARAQRGPAVVLAPPSLRLGLRLDLGVDLGVDERLGPQPAPAQHDHSAPPPTTSARRRRSRRGRMNFSAVWPTKYAEQADGRRPCDAAQRVPEEEGRPTTFAWRPPSMRR